jgi:C4-dicarboxylate-specific signal transduction histidine kinase
MGAPLNGRPRVADDGAMRSLSGSFPASAGVPSAREVARLGAAARVATGAAHALCNALAALVAEASYLHDECKEDPLVSESCGALLAELDRCASLARGLLPTRMRSDGEDARVDLGRLVRMRVELLQETLGSLHQIEVRTPEAATLVHADTATLELLVTCLVQYAADHAVGASHISLEVEPQPAEGEVALRMQVMGNALSEDATAALGDPRRAPDAVWRATLAFAAEALADLGGRRSVAITAPDTWALLIHLPAIS